MLSRGEVLQLMHSIPLTKLDTLKMEKKKHSSENKKMEIPGMQRITEFSITEEQSHGSSLSHNSLSHASFLNA